MRPGGETFGFSPDHHHIAHTSQKLLQTPELVSARFQDSCRDDGSGETLRPKRLLPVSLVPRNLSGAPAPC